MMIATLQATAHTIFSTMQSEKKGNTEALTAFLDHVWEMIPHDLNEREESRDALKNMYHSWLLDIGKDLEDAGLRPYVNLYYRLDMFFKLCKDVSHEQFHKAVVKGEKEAANLN